MKKLILILLLLFINIYTVSCNENKECIYHNYEHGVCIDCGYICGHIEFIDYICFECGIKQEEVCEHIYKRGICELCNYECIHQNVQNNKCLECNINIQNICSHQYICGKCIKCNKDCNHKTCINGVCQTCLYDLTYICNHEYLKGMCSKCNYICLHNGLGCGKLCNICYSMVPHTYIKTNEGEKCSMCNKVNNYSITSIPDKYLDVNCPNKGTVEKIVYDSYDYKNNVNTKNTLYVYLPYGYNANNKEYNILYLLHGSGENSAYWLAQAEYSGGYTKDTLTLLDNLNYYNVCEPTIVVTPTENLNGTANFYKELVDYIMPIVETKYRTKAGIYQKDLKDVKKEDFISSREFRAYAGLSLGSMICWSVMAYDLPYISYFGFYSGGTWSLTGLTDIVINEVNKSSYDVKYAFHSCGDQDSMYANHMDDYKRLISETNHKFVEEYNTEFLIKPGFTHNYKAWILDLYNSLGYTFFKYNENGDK